MFDDWIIIIIAVALLLYLFDRYVKWHLYPKRWGIVEKSSIFRSGQLTPRQIRRQVTAHDIDVIISLMTPLPGDLSYEAEVGLTKEGLERYVYPLFGDGTGDIDKYAAAIEKIHDSVRSSKKVLVHCAAGAQRTGGVIAMYRILVQGKSIKFAMSEMERYGWRPKKNPALVPYINENLEKLVELLIERNVLENLPSELPYLIQGFRDAN
ncbi:MAG: hypothetical protein CL398_11375 [Acidiferrobacteraceae bacterium]|nr:hypothetical protein [Acidiferrobacteraceae bacterium]